MVLGRSDSVQFTVGLSNSVLFKVLGPSDSVQLNVGLSNSTVGTIHSGGVSV